MSSQNCGEKHTPLNLTLSREKVGDKSRYAQNGTGQAGVDEVKQALLFLVLNMSAVEVSPFIGSGRGRGGGGRQRESQPSKTLLSKKAVMCIPS